MKTLIAVPDLRKRGGVAGYFTALRTHFDEDVFYFTRGARTGEVMPLFRIIRDYIGFYRAASDVDVGLVHLNTSLSAGGIFRDAGFVLLAKMLRKKVVVFFRGWDSRFQRRIEKYGLRLFSRIYFKADGLIVLGIEFEEIFREWGYRGPIFRETTAFDERLLEEAGVPAIPQKKDGRFNILFLA